jgi:aminobenzoyl-glutamate transport protein
LLPYIPWVLVWLMHFDKKASFDTLIHYTWRYSAAMLVSWIILFVAWYMLNIPFGF